MNHFSVITQLNVSVMCEKDQGLVLEVSLIVNSVIDTSTQKYHDIFINSKIKYSVCVHINQGKMKCEVIWG